MGKDTGIDWCNHTFNAWWGCTKVSAECDNCYAEKWAARVGYSESGELFPIWGKDTVRRFFLPKHWEELIAWDIAAAKAGEVRRVFWNSMSDIMEEHPDLAPWRSKAYDYIERTPNLQHLLLTKRPQNFRKFLPGSWLKDPRKNVIGMTTVGLQSSYWRVKELAQVPFARRGISAEPLLGPLDLADGGAAKGWSVFIDWVIVGGESGPGARPMHPDWARSIRDQCVAEKVPFFFKQWGEYGPTYCRSRYAPVSSPEPKSAYPWGNYVYSPRVGKKAAGALLDGREWREFPV